MGEMKLKHETKDGVGIIKLGLTYILYGKFKMAWQLYHSSHASPGWSEFSILRVLNITSYLE